MPVTSIFWNEGTGFDLHVMRGQKSGRLDEMLALALDVGDPVFAKDAPGKNTPNEVTVQFKPLCNTNYTQHQVSVDEDTGEVEAKLLPFPPPSPRLRNFLIQAIVKNPPGQNPATPFEHDIRVHVHEDIDKIWLTPAPLTIRKDADGQKLTILAKFDDGVIGDITDWQELNWLSSAPGAISVNSSTGVLQAQSDNVQATITVQVKPLPAAPNRTASATVKAIAPWSTPRTLKFITGKGRNYWNDVPNMLFVPDGFTNAEKKDFEKLVRQTIYRIRTKRTFFPFNLMSDELNFWTAFVPSRESGVTDLPEVETFWNGNVNGRDRFTAHRIPHPQAPTHNSPWNVAEMLHQVGFPVPTDDPLGRPLTGGSPPDPPDKLPDWQTLYGNHVVLANVQANYLAWLNLSERTLMNERDTAFGLRLGERPRSEQNDYPRTLGLNKRRTTDEHLKVFLESLQGINKRTGDVLFTGTTWSTGKDKGLVCFLSRDRRQGGTNWGIYYTASLGNEQQRTLIAAVNGQGIDPEVVNIPKTIPINRVGTVVHETAHSLNLQDEYGGKFQFPDAKANTLASEGNVQARVDLIVDRHGVDYLDGDKIKWLWPRIEKVGILSRVTQAEGQEFRIFLEKGHGSQFIVDDIVRLRQRSLLTPTKPASPQMRVTAVDTDKDELRVFVIFNKSLVPADYPIGSLLMAPVRDKTVDNFDAGILGRELSLVSSLIQDHITATGGPLNAPKSHRRNPNGPRRACVRDRKASQDARNIPVAALLSKHPRYLAWIVGLYEGGADYYCGIYHPTGACLMRSIRADPKRLYRFCPVCRYVMIDRLKPTLHGKVDEYFQNRDPQP